MLSPKYQCMRAFVSKTQETTKTNFPLMYWENETYNLRRLHFISEHSDWLRNFSPQEVKKKAFVTLTHVFSRAKSMILLWLAICLTKVLK